MTPSPASTPSRPSSARTRPRPSPSTRPSGVSPGCKPWSLLTVGIDASRHLRLATPDAYAFQPSEIRDFHLTAANKIRRFHTSPDIPFRGSGLAPVATRAAGRLPTTVPRKRGLPVRLRKLTGNHRVTPETPYV